MFSTRNFVSENRCLYVAFCMKPLNYLLCALREGVMAPRCQALGLLLHPSRCPHPSSDSTLPRGLRLRPGRHHACWSRCHSSPKQFHEEGVGW